MAEISIVVPVYKVQSFLHRCVDSILNQSFESFEAALVDDGSPDDSGCICDEYALLDNRIITVHQTNGGQSRARNVAIEMYLSSDSHWIAFVDSDDWVHRRYLEKLCEANIQNSTDISMCQFVTVSEYMPDMLAESDDYKKMRSADSLVFRDSCFSAYAWGILYKKNIFSEARFPEGMIMEDFYLIPDVIMNYSEEVSIVDDPLYFYFQHAGSTLHNITYKCYCNTWAGYDKQISLLQEKQELDLLKLQINTYVKHIHSCLCSIQSKHLDQHDNKTKRYVKRKLKTQIHKSRGSLDMSDEFITFAIKEVDPLLYIGVRYKRFQQSEENSSKSFAAFVLSMIRKLI